MSVSDGFKTLIKRIQTTDAEIDKFNKHAEVITNVLKKAFSLQTVKNHGSHSRGTAIRKYSDLDLFCVVSKEDFKWGDSLMSSNTVLSKFKDALVERYTQSAIGRDGQAIVLNFFDGTKIDVIPAVFKNINQYKKPTYLIPDGDFGWLETTPETYTSIIKDVHEASGYKFSYVIQLLKYWRECRTPRIPILSFHIEYTFAILQTFSEVKSYAECLYDAFDLLYSRKCAALRDPLSISGLIPIACTESQKEQIYAALSSARDKVARAINAEYKGNNETACNYWNLIFNGGFPAL